MVTFRLYDELRQRLAAMLGASSHAFGYVSPEWLTAQVKRWGPQTHHIQLKASIVLKVITANGLHVDLAARQELSERLGDAEEELRQRLHQHGYVPGQKGCDNKLQQILLRLEQTHPEVSLLRTSTNKYATTREALDNLANFEPFISDLLDFKSLEKLRTSFLKRWTVNGYIRRSTCFWSQVGHPHLARSMPRTSLVRTRCDLVSTPHQAMS